MKVTVSPFYNGHHLNKEGTGSVSIRVTFNRKKKYYPIGVSLTPEAYERVMGAKRRTDSERETFDLIQAAELRAKEVVKELPLFTFGLFEERFLSARASIGTVKGAFESYIKELHTEGRISTAESYESAMSSLTTYQKGLTFPDITPKFLREYERDMLKEGKSISTVGIYLRNLRAIFNREKIDSSIYPFGKGKYTIPSSKNIKKALTLDDVIKIASYQTNHPQRAFARDMWVLSFQCNGMNMKDILLLRRSSINGDTLTYVREKSARTKRDVERIQVSLKEESKEILRRWGSTRALKEKDPFILPYLTDDMPPLRIRRVTAQVIKNINTYLKEIGKELELGVNLTTYSARHSFATVLLRAGVSTEFISEALGHGSLKTTASYLAGFDGETIHRQTEILTGIKKKAE